MRRTRSDADSLRRTLARLFSRNTPTPQIYTLSLHDALPIYRARCAGDTGRAQFRRGSSSCGKRRSEEHTSELQSLTNLVCRLLPEKKKAMRGIHAPVPRRSDAFSRHIVPAVPLRVCKTEPAA